MSAKATVARIFKGALNVLGFSRSSAAASQSPQLVQSPDPVSGVVTHTHRGAKPVAQAGASRQTHLGALQ